MCLESTSTSSLCGASSHTLPHLTPMTREICTAPSVYQALFKDDNLTSPSESLQAWWEPWTEAWSTPGQHSVPGLSVGQKAGDHGAGQTEETWGRGRHRCTGTEGAAGAWTVAVLTLMMQQYSRRAGLSAWRQPCPGCPCPSGLPVYSGPGSWRQQWGCQDAHFVIHTCHCVVLSAFTKTSTLFMLDLSYDAGL